MASCMSASEVITLKLRDSFVTTFAQTGQRGSILSSLRRSRGLRLATSMAYFSDEGLTATKFGCAATLRFDKNSLLAIARICPEDI